MKKRWITAAALASISLGGIYYSTTHSPPLHSFTTLTAKQATIKKQAVAVGEIMPAQVVKVKSQIGGIIDDIYVRVGEHVTVHSPLVKLRPNPTPQDLTAAHANLLKSQADLELARKTLQNYQRLVAQNIIPANFGDYIKSKAQLKSAQATVEQSQQDMDLKSRGESTAGNVKLTSIISAPITGTVIDIKVDVGEPIISTESNQAATEIMTMADMSNIIFKGTVSEHDAAQLSEGMPVTLTLSPYPEKKVEGVLTKVAVQSEKLNDNNANSNQQQQSFDNGFAVEVSQIKFPKGMVLRSGFSATAEITLSKADDVMTLPERALHFDGDTAQVLIPDDSEQGYHYQPVTLGLSDGINVEIKTGIDTKQSLIDASTVGDSND
ncbi:efflux transporter periplasmic adaptor subunit [Photobacterium aquimaris]|uniref:efflux RND transporter periplasmic adaptor subunit n=1 Tax=Photobacterium aquimaris TaxID=512643 RepID=UPI0007F02C7E|nr:efflux RND transporter periplasmic adaptor subunit [Photobacterium aquimaris]OBU13865.1 efflux transporter periplasmic adaptor subunit [Photobacterium aquimaris]PSW01500.1 efflux RND transporter periplasmic adaptor subunit [Photobacterium aquimaris]